MAHQKIGTVFVYSEFRIVFVVVRLRPEALSLESVPSMPTEVSLVSADLCKWRCCIFTARLMTFLIEIERLPCWRAPRTVRVRLIIRRSPLRLPLLRVALPVVSALLFALFASCVPLLLELLPLGGLLLGRLCLPASSARPAARPGPVLFLAVARSTRIGSRWSRSRLSAVDSLRS